MTTTTYAPGTCTTCGGSFDALPYKSRAGRLVAHMVNAGELTVAEARAELASEYGPARFDREIAELLAGWIMDCSDAGLPENYHAGMTNRPVSFVGTDEERTANQRTHSYDYEASRCIFCDCRPWGTYADYPCGAEVAREWV